jgi:hypothetical protein
VNRSTSCSLVKPDLYESPGLTLLDNRGFHPLCCPDVSGWWLEEFYHRHLPSPRKIILLFFKKGDGPFLPESQQILCFVYRQDKEWQSFFFDIHSQSCTMGLHNREPPERVPPDRSVDIAHHMAEKAPRRQTEKGRLNYYL